MGIDINKILEIIKDPDLKLKINDLYSENISLKEENFKIKKEIEILKNIEDLDKKLIHENNHYFLQKEDKKMVLSVLNVGILKRKLIRLHDLGFNNGVHHFECPNCKTYANTGEYIQPDYQAKNWDIY